MRDIFQLCEFHDMHNNIECEMHEISALKNQHQTTHAIVDE